MNKSIGSITEFHYVGEATHTQKEVVKSLLENRGKTTTTFQTQR